MLKSQRDLSVDCGRADNEEINIQFTTFAERHKDVFLKETNKTGDQGNLQQARVITIS